MMPRTIPIQTITTTTRTKTSTKSKRKIKKKKTRVVSTSTNTFYSIYAQIICTKFCEKWIKFLNLMIVLIASAKSQSVRGASSASFHE